MKRQKGAVFSSFSLLYCSPFCQSRSPSCKLEGKWCEEEGSLHTIENISNHWKIFKKFQNFWLNCKQRCGRRQTGKATECNGSSVIVSISSQSRISSQSSRMRNTDTTFAVPRPLFETTQHQAFILHPDPFRSRFTVSCLMLFVQDISNKSLTAHFKHTVLSSEEIIPGLPQSYKSIHIVHRFV